MATVPNALDLKEGDKAIIRQMDEHLVSIGSTIFIEEAKKGRLNERLHRLAQCNLDPGRRDKDGRTPAIHAVIAGYGIGELECMWAYDLFDVADHNGDLPLHFAVRLSRLACIERLLWHAVKTALGKNAQGLTPIDLVAACGGKEVTERFCHALLCGYIRKGNAEEVDRLAPIVKQGSGECGLDSPAMYTHTTPLQHACWLHATACIQHLLRHGADPNVCDREGLSPVRIAASREDVTAVKALLAAGADPLRKDRLGYTPRSFLLKRGEALKPSPERKCMAMLEAGGKPTQKDWMGSASIPIPSSESKSEPEPEPEPKSERNYAAMLEILKAGPLRKDWMGSAPSASIPIPLSESERNYAAILEILEAAEGKRS